jgi:hypothetical protein
MTTEARDGKKQSRPWSDVLAIAILKRFCAVNMKDGVITTVLSPFKQANMVHRRGNNMGK